jgi:hypothetical protein
MSPETDIVSGCPLNIKREFTLRCTLTIAVSVRCIVLPKLKALVQELDVKRTQSNLAKSQNNSKYFFPHPNPYP